MTKTNRDLFVLQRGFTLVELAIVMIIIGLLIGGILKGQELIANAQITNAVTQIKGLDGAVSTFREAYNAFPGDMNNADVRIVGCTGTCANGDGDGRLDSVVGAAPTLTSEDVYFFNQMRAADLITGLDGTATLAFGSALPLASIGGGFSAGHTGSGPVVGFVPTTMRSGHYIVLQGSTGAVDAADAAILTGNQAARIDRKLDDGSPNAGSVLGTGAGGGAGCADGLTETSVYNEAVAGSLCSLAVRVQG